MLKANSYNSANVYSKKVAIYHKTQPNKMLKVLNVPLLTRNPQDDIKAEIETFSINSGLDYSDLFYR